MRTVNKVILIGNVTKDPFIKDLPGGKIAAMFTVATNRMFKTPNGETQSESEYTQCVAWGHLAELAAGAITKGKLVYIEGRLKTRQIPKDNGEMIFKTEVVIINLIFLSKREDAPGYHPHHEEDMVDPLDGDDLNY